MLNFTITELTDIYDLFDLLVKHTTNDFSIVETFEQILDGWLKGTSDVLLSKFLGLLTYNDEDRCSLDEALKYKTHTHHYLITDDVLIRGINHITTCADCRNGHVAAIWLHKLVHRTQCNKDNPWYHIEALSDGAFECMVVSAYKYGNEGLCKFFESLTVLDASFQLQGFAKYLPAATTAQVLTTLFKEEAPYDASRLFQILFWNADCSPDDELELHLRAQEVFTILKRDATNEYLAALNPMAQADALSYLSTIDALRFLRTLPRVDALLVIEESDLTDDTKKSFTDLL